MNNFWTLLHGRFGQHIHNNITGNLWPMNRDCDKIITSLSALLRSSLK